METVNTGRRITVHEAQVRTAAVAIKALTISGKQVTLAVFRQLQEEPLLDPETGQLNGIPWGVVNYHPDNCRDIKAHIHVVWQKGTELRRSFVYQEWPQEGKSDDKLFRLRSRIQSFDELLYIQHARTGTPIVIKDNTAIFELEGWSIHYKSEPYRQDLHYWVSGYKEPKREYDRDRGIMMQEPAETTARRIAETETRMAEAEANAKVKLGLQPEHCPTLRDTLYNLRQGIRDYYTQARQEQRKRANWAKQFEALSALDQLFIAV